MVTLFNKWLVLALVPAVLYLGKSGAKSENQAPLPHPLHVSVTEINHNASDKTLEISCKLFTDDFEKVLAQNYKTKIDLINPTDRPAMEKIVNDYIHKHLSIKGDGKVLSFSALGFEKDNDAIYSYFQVDNMPSIKKIEVNNELMFDLFTDQINLMHVIVGGNRKSTKLNYPDKEAAFNY